MMNIFNQKSSLLIALLMLTGVMSRAQSYNVDINMTPEQMIQNLVGPGVTISNVVVTACDSTYGYYTSNGTEIGTNQGLLLTTGKALYSVGPNNTIGNCSTSQGTCDYFDNDCPGSTLLNQAQDRTTYDATMFEFDITPQGDSLRFNYTFASEEYNEWVNSPFNDVFGFYITGPNVGTDVNIALVPNTAQVVAINTVNALSNSSYFYNNQNPLGQYIQYDGFTIGLYAAIGNLIPCETYHLKLVIADGTDHVYDSGVFINSIESNPIIVLTATSNGLDYMVEGCNTGTISFSRTVVTPDPQDVLFWIGGTATNGLDYTPQIGSGIPLDLNSITIPANSQSVSFDISAALDGIDEGQEYITVYLGNPLCSGNQVLDSVNFYIYDYLDLDLSPEDSSICAGQCLDLVGVSNVSDLADFVWSSNVIDPIGLTAQVCPTETTTYGLTAIVGDCEITDEVTVNVSSITVELEGTDINCEGGTTGSISVTIIDGLEPYTYIWTGPDGFTSTDSLPTNLAPGEYCVEVTDAAGCVASGCATLVQTNELTATSVLSDYSCSMVSCFGSCDGSIDITTDGGVEPFTFEWTGDDGFTANTEDITGLCAGSYDLVITDDVGCQYTNSYTLTEPDSVTLVVVGSTDLLCTGVETGEASVQAAGGCPVYTYSWSHDAGVTGPVATNLGSGTYQVSVTDQNGCTSDGSVTIVINDPIDPLNVTIDEISIYPGGYSVSCPGAEDGYINITIAGGLAPYISTWQNVTTGIIYNTEDLTNAPCGEYSLIVLDDNGCTFSQSLQLTCVPDMSVELDITDNPCGAPDLGAGSIDVISTSGGQGDPYTYEWNGPSCSPCSTQNITNLNSGVYVLTVTDAQGCEAEFTATISQNDAFEASGDVTQPTCAGTCNGEIDITVVGDSSTGPPPFIIDASTQIQICVTGTHSWVSDLAFHLVGPPNCGSPDILMSPNPGANGQGNICNSGNDITNLCFSSESTNNLDVCAGAPFTLSGTFGSYGASATPIDWSALNGCDVSEPGWAVQIYDCVSGDFGALTDATMTFSGINSLGDPTTAVYSTAVGFNSPINDNSCDPSSASVFYVDQSIIGGGGDPGNYTYTWTGPGGYTASTQDITGLCPGTYTVNISSGTCEQTLTFDIIDPEQLEVVEVAIINPTCFGQNNGSIDIDVIGGSGDYSYVWIPSPSCFFSGANTQDISSLFECTYNYSITDNVTGCNVVGSFTLDAPQVMDIVIVTSDFDGGYNISCHGANDGQISVFVTGGTPDCTLFAPYCYDYDWITDCTELDPEEYGYDPNADSNSGLYAGTYGINVYDANGCLATTCLDLIEPDSIQSPAVIENIDCVNSTGCITPNLSGGSGLYLIYEWTGDIGSNTPDAPTLCGLAAGDYSLTITDSNNCQDTFYYEISEIPQLTATVISTTDVSCYGACDGEVEVTLDGGEAPIMCTITGGPLPSPIVITELTTGTTVIPNLCAGDYTMEHEDINGCTATVTFTINQPDSLTIDLLSIIQEAGQIYDLQCLGDTSGAIDATISGGTFPYTYIWTDELLNIIGSDEDIDSLQAGTYCLTVLDFNGCSAQACITLTEPSEALTATSEVSVYNDIYNVSCYNATDGFIDITVAGGVPGYTFEWNGDGTVNNQEDQTGLGAGTYDVLVIDSNFCTTLLEFQLIEPTPITIDATVSLFDGGYNVSCNGVCDGSISIVIAGGNPGYSVEWTGPNGFTSTDENLTDLCGGTYTVTVTDANNCTEQQSITLTQPAILTAEINSSPNCSTGNVDLCVTVTGGSGNYTYSWSNGSTSACTVVTQDGQVCVTVTDSNGCTAEVCVDIDVEAPLNVSGTVTNTSCGLCLGAIDLTVSGGFPPYDISWTGGSTSQDLTDLCAGTYTVIVTDASGCSIELPFTVLDTPGVTITTQQQDVRCNGEATGTASAIITGGTAPYDIVWTDAQFNEVGTGSSIQGLTAGVYTVTVTDANDCGGSSQVIITEPSALIIDEVEVSVFGNFNISSPNGTDGTIHVGVIGGTPEYIYSWTPEGLPAEHELTGLGAGDYTVTITDANGCTVDSLITLTAPRDFMIYTALSPNGDGFNDTYVIDGAEFCPGNQFKVFNRWGNLVYEKNNYYNQWYGQDKDNAPLADGTYFVIFEGCSKEVSTYVDLRRE
ncbi:MAG: choice-of-anchor L domain-containing protein [Flavobacteriales bacterium]|nr:choice-of-anchor L domain-containing protein [Flavobacteriales bacterium]